MSIKNNDIPVDIMPDEDFAKAKDLMLYQYAPGTKTLDAQNLDVTKQKNEADALQAALALKETSTANEADNQYKTAALAESIRNDDLQNQYQMGNLAETARGNTLQNQYQMGTLAAKASQSAPAATVNPFATTSTTATTPTTQKTLKYTDQRLDAYINGLRSRLKTPSAVLTYIENNTKGLEPNFRQAVLERLNYHLTGN
jgi:type IV secretory pathway VirJ component